LKIHAQFDWVDADAIVGGTWCPTDGFLLPQVIYQEAMRDAVANGARLVNGAAVLGARFDGRSISAVRTPKGWFEADLFVDCTNAWTTRTGALLGGTHLPVEALKRYLWFLHRDTAMPAQTLTAMPLVIAPSGAYCRPENSETLMFGKKYDVATDPDFSYDDQDTIDPNFTHTAGIEAVPYEVWMELAEKMPALAEFTGVAATTAGFYGTTPDHNPFLGFDPQVPNLIRAVGFSGHGAMMGPFNAAAVTALVAAGTDITFVKLDEGDVPMDGFAIGRSFQHAESMVI
jgi:glycine/D-amino acid oxidase-like deaminating enzyme